MAEFEFTHDGTPYKIDAEDEKSALAKLNSHIGKESSKLSPENHPFTKLAIDPARTYAATRTFARNIPVIGDYIGSDPYEEQFKKEAPVTHKATEIAGVVLPAGAASAALQTPAALSRGLPWLASQTALGTALGGADKAAQQHSQGQPFNTADILKAMAVGGGSTIAGAGASKMLSPNMGIPAIKSYVPTPPKGNTYEDVLARTRWNNPANQRTQEQLAELINARRLENAKAAFEAAPPSKVAGHVANVAGTALGHAVDPTGGVLTHLAKAFHQNVLKNQVMNDPQRAAMMQAIMMAGGQNFNRLPDAQ